MGVNSLPKTVTRQRRDCDLNPDPSVQHANHSATEPVQLESCYFARDRGARSIVMSVSVCLCVCLSVRDLISITARPIFTKFFYARYLGPSLGLPQTA